MAANPINDEGSFAQAALAYWRLLGQELRQDVEQFNQRGESASFSRISDHEYRISNSKSGLEVRIIADSQDHIARYDFIRTGDQSAGAPVGGILSMRLGQSGVNFYSSDQPLTGKEARALLLDPVLNPPAM